MRRIVVTLGLSLCSLLSPSAARVAAAQDARATHDAQLWVQILATVKVSPDWMVHLEGQPRWSEDAGDLNQVIVRTALGRRLTDRASLWGGYAWVPRTLGPGTRHEQRAWQQLSATLPNAGAWTPSLRIRLEQRFLDGWQDASHRLRVMGRIVRPLNADRSWLLAAWNEALFTVDDTVGGPQAGVDQNRLFAGVARRLSPKATLETGYLWQTMDPAGAAPRAHGHTAFAWLNLSL